MANTEVPLSIIAAPAGNFATAVVIGSQQYTPPSAQDNSYWFSVYDRYTLKQVYSYVQAGKGDTVPADLSGKYNTDQYFLVVATRTLYSAYVPAGALFTFLVDSGASTEMKKLTQAYQQLGCGSLGVVNYVMAGTLGPGQPSHPRVEASVIGASQSLFFEATLIGVQVGSQTLYTPFPLTDPTL